MGPGRFFFLENPEGGAVLEDTIEEDDIPDDVCDAVDASDVGLLLWNNESSVKISRTTQTPEKLDVRVEETVLPLTDTGGAPPKVGLTEKV
jgi:hypothetical protein